MKTLAGLLRPEGGGGEAQPLEARDVLDAPCRPSPACRAGNPEVRAGRGLSRANCSNLDAFISQCLLRALGFWIVFVLASRPQAGAMIPI